MTPASSTPPSDAQTSTSSEPGPLQRLGDQEWQILCEKDDRTSPAEYPEMLLITRAELGAVMSEAYLLAKDQDRTRISTLEQELRASNAALERVVFHVQHGSIYGAIINHSDPIIEAARRRRTT